MFDTSQTAFRHLGRIVSENTRTLIAWVGAGLSRQAGLPTWDGLRKLLTEELEKKAKSISSPDGELTGKLKAAREQENFWIAFRILREGLGDTTFRSVVKDALGPATTIDPPRAYEDLWRLRLSGMLNLNLDQFASRAFVNVHGAKYLTIFHGKDAPRYAHVLSSPTSAFTANLHGTTDDVGSWVFTDEDLRRLTETQGYKEFITTCALARTLVFVGISANDVAAGGHLARLRDSGIDFGTHFWITDKCDAKSDEWAEKSGVRVIRYANPDGKHQELQQCIEALLRMAPVEEDACPVLPMATGRSSADVALPSPDELVRGSDAETIRGILNAHARRILADESMAGYMAYEQFCLDYDEAINRAWYVPTNPAVLSRRPTMLMGYRIIKPIAIGGFGTVFEAENDNGETVAIKLLHEAVRTDSEHLQSFRRGVRSMRLLTQANVEGVVRYYDASEIPAVAVMEYVPGPTLHDAVLRKILSWSEVLRIGVTLAQVLRRSHRLPQRILHRDFRPRNIMFRESWDGDEDWDLVVLDFDLSWHKDSQEKSMTLESYSGYLAPEQVQRDSKYSTRNALVDSYGLGMTLYFIRSGREPSFAQPGQADWSQHLQDLSSQIPCKGWNSLPRRFYRLVLNCTHIKQPLRWDVMQIENELARLNQALSSPSQVRSAELLAEEIVARAFPNAYTWDSDRLAAVRQLLDESKLRVVGNESDRTVDLVAEWTDTGNNHWAQTKQWGDGVLNKAGSILDRAGWSIRKKRATAKTLTIEADISVEDLVNKVQMASEAIVKINDLLIRR